MGNRITVIEMKLLRSGVEVRGIARSDRGTKYIADSVVVPFAPDSKYPSKAALETAIKTLMGET